MNRSVVRGVGMAAVLALSSSAGAHGGHQHPAASSAPAAVTSPAPTRDAVATAAMFSTALSKGDEITVKGLLAEDVIIYESGGQESSRAEYAANHMKTDMAFLAGSRIEILDRKHGESGDLGWVLTRSRISGAHEGKPFDLYSTESLVLKRTAGAWKIVHIHWSSQPVAPKGA